MNTKLLLIAIIIGGLSSCSTVYKSVQTPDDVYYSPAPPHNDYVSTRTDENKNIYNGQSDNVSDRRIINNRRWRRYHDYDYDYGYDYGYYPYGYYPYSYYPYGYSPVYINPKTGKAATINTPRKFNLGTYRNPGIIPPTTSVIDTKTAQPSSTPVRTFRTQPVTQPANGSSVGNLIRRVFSPSNSGNSSYDNSGSTRTFDTRTSNNSSSNNSSGGSRSSSSGGGNAPVRSFPK